ncbi:hypothetical protein CB1_000711019 [Camelus ferus]|nr:hypothetical protein CB1_000711019 [Camelus ferus]
MILFVETIDVNGKTLEGPVPLEVIVIDQNDNRPIFREGPYIGHVMEGSPTVYPDAISTNPSRRKVTQIYLSVQTGDHF